MASRPEFVQYVTEQLQEAGAITYRKMFGEYGLYCDGKIFALICDDQLFIKITEAGKKICPDLEEAPPYEGAKPYFLIDDIDNRELLTEIVVETCKELPLPKPKKAKHPAGIPGCHTAVERKGEKKRNGKTGL
jgi:TfoX/Sxy family transcriptional regulator of competence genes